MTSDQTCIIFRVVAQTRGAPDDGDCFELSVWFSRFKKHYNSLRRPKLANFLGTPEVLTGDRSAGMATGLWPRVFGPDIRYSHRLWVFPLVAGTSWFSTLSILLLRWLALGRPRYPGQVNPEIPFISDIAAFNFQPVFIVGCAVTGVSFAGTVFAVHHVRYSPVFYGLADDAPWRQATSLLALFIGFFASVCLVCLSIFDTFENSDEHRYILMCTFAGLGLASILTAVVWWDEACGMARFAGLRKW